MWLSLFHYDVIASSHFLKIEAKILISSPRRKILENLACGDKNNRQNSDKKSRKTSNYFFGKNEDSKQWATCCFTRECAKIYEIF